MSRTVGRRKSSLKNLSVNKPLTTGAKIKFQWSVSAAHLAVPEDPPAIILPPIPPEQPRRRVFTVSSLSTNLQSVSQFSMSTQKSSSTTHATQQCQSPVSVRSDKGSAQSYPLSLTYAQLRQSRVSPPTKRRKQPRLSIFSVADDKRDSVSILNPSAMSDASERHDSISALYPIPSVMADASEKRDSITALNFNPSMTSRSSLKRDSLSLLNLNPSMTSRTSLKRDSLSLLNLNPSVTSRPSLTTPPSMAVLSTNGDYRFGTDRFLRLNSPQLRRLNVSEKYINEAKKLYYNAECKIFTPRLSTTQVF